MKLTKGVTVILPPEVSGGAAAEVFEVYRIITQPGLPAAVTTAGKVLQEATDPSTTVLLTGVNTGTQVAINLDQLAELGWAVDPRKDTP